MWNGSNQTLTPKIFNSLLGVTSDVQLQIDSIKNGSDVNKNSENIFTKNNTFTATVNASKIETEELTVSTSLNMIGLTAYEGYKDRTDSTRHIYRNPSDNNSGKIAAVYKIQCLGEAVHTLIFYTNVDASNKLIKDTNGTRLTANEFWAKYSYDTENGLVEISSQSIISPSLYSAETSVEGGLIECLYLSTLDLKVNGEMELSGDIKMGSGKVAMTYGNIDLSSGSINLDVGSVTAASFLASSDYRLKYDVHTISGSYYTVDNLRPVTYNFKYSGESHMGFIAHELQEHFPTAVLGEKDGTEMQSVNYAELIPVLVKEIQDLKKEVSLLKRQYLMM
jgi:hypothetical protein